MKYVSGASFSSRRYAKLITCGDSRGLKIHESMNFGVEVLQLQTTLVERPGYHAYQVNIETITIPIQTHSNSSIRIISCSFLALLDIATHL